MALLDRIRRGLGRHGLVGSARVLRRKLAPEPFDTALVWYELDLAGDRPRRPLEPPLVLRRAGEHEVAVLDELPVDPSVTTLGHDEARDRLAGGGTLWYVAEDERIAFACWTFRARMPVWGAPGGVLDLPADVVGLEDSHSSPAFRGRGVAPGAWTAIADRCVADGARAMVTKVNVDNTASRRAVEKVGFAEVARMRMVRRRRRLRIEVAPGGHREGPPRQWLRALERG